LVIEHAKGIVDAVSVKELLNIGSALRFGGLCGVDFGGEARKSGRAYLRKTSVEREPFEVEGPVVDLEQRHLAEYAK
jgi:hypothetical protein